MPGAHNKSPPKPKNVFIWDVQTVLRYLDSLPENKKLSIRILTQKLAMVLSLAEASRSSEISILNANYLIDKGDAIIFYFQVN